MKKKISILLPVFNEQENISTAYKALKQEFEPLADRYDFEYIFTDNHSEDKTFAEIRKLAAGDPAVKALRFSRNFGFQRSLITAYRHARGDAAVQIDVDLQDPPSLILKFIELWEQGHDVVVGLRVRRAERGLVTLMRSFFYNLLNRISDDDLPPGAGDFRLTDKSVYSQLRAIEEHSPYVRGLISSLAARPGGIEYERRRRQRGQSKFPLIKLLTFAADGIFAHSVLPLRLATLAGFIAFIVSIVMGLFYLTRYIVFGAEWPAGTPTIVLLILASTGLNGLFLGILGEYIGRIFMNNKQRPTVIVEEAINISDNKTIW